MMDETYLVRFKASWIGTECVVAASAEVRGGQIVLLTSEGKLAGLYVLEAVESWSVLPH
jgi:hypothetical protein